MKIKITEKNRPTEYFLKQLNELMLEHDITDKQLMEIMDYKNTESIRTQFIGTSKPTWTETYKLINYLYATVSNFSADLLFKEKDDVSVNDTIADEIAKPTYAKLYNDYTKLSAKYEKLQQKYNSLQDIANAYNKLSETQQCTLIHLINAPDFKEFLKTLWQFSDRKKTSQNGKFEYSQKQLFNTYDFSNISNLLDVLCQQAVLDLRKHWILSQQEKHQAEWKEAQADYKSLHNKLLNEEYKIYSPRTKKQRKYKKFVENLEDERLPYTDDYLKKKFGNCCLYKDLARHPSKNFNPLDFGTNDSSWNYESISVSDKPEDN